MIEKLLITLGVIKVRPTVFRILPTCRSIFGRRDGDTEKYVYVSLADENLGAITLRMTPDTADIIAKQLAFTVKVAS